MHIKTFAKLFGVVFLLVGLSAFIPGVTTPHAHPGAADVMVGAGLGAAMGLFPVNVLHNLFHVAFGIWGLVAARSFGAARLYAKGVAVIYTALALFGLIPAAKLWTTFGLIPLYGNDVWLHILLAAIAGYFGFIRRDSVEAATVHRR
jgi:hypothetical protein